MPDPDDSSLYRPAEDFIRRYKNDLAVVATIRTGLSNTYLSMGIEHFCASLVMDPNFVEEILWRFSHWTRKVVQNLQVLDFDLFFIPDDIGFGSAPMISPEHFRKHCIPPMRNVIEVMRIPAVYHSDGNIMPLMEDILSLGVAGLANFEPGAMDIEKVKELYGDRVTLIGNIDLHYTLTQGSAEETEDEVRRRIAALAPGGRYILSSANSLPRYVKPDNVSAMGRALLKYGGYDSVSLTKPRRLKKKSEPESIAEASPAAESLPPVKPKYAGADSLIIIRDAVIGYRLNEIEALVKGGLESQIEPDRIINDALIKAMETVGQRFSENLIFVPEMVLAAKTMQAGLKVIKPLMVEDHTDSKGKVLLATVRGDLHDIGKNLVGMMLEGSGFTVIDIGINVGKEAITEKLIETGAEILGLSALLTTTIPEMEKVIRWLNREGLRDKTKVIVGGAPVTQSFADQIGADGYGQDAGGAVELCRKVLLQDPSA